jgi:hypothetical protein
MDAKRGRELAHEAASTLAFLFVMLVLMFLVLQDTALTNTDQARATWLVIGVALGAPALLCWLYCKTSERGAGVEGAPRQRSRRT